MALPQRTLAILEEIKELSLSEGITYVLYGSEEALALYGESLDALLRSECLDFDVITCDNKKGKKPEILLHAFEIESYCIVNRNECDILHDNICKKVKYNLVDPMREKWLKEWRGSEN